jgi:hypothetical protein
MRLIFRERGLMDCHLKEQSSWYCRSGEPTASQFGPHATDIHSCHPTSAITSPYFFFVASGVGLSSLYCGHFWPIVPTPDDRWGWLWSNWWNEDWKGNRSTMRKRTAAQLCPPQIPLDQTRAAAVGSQRLTAWAMTRPFDWLRNWPSVPYSFSVYK